MSAQDDRSRFEAVHRRTHEQILGYAVGRCSSPEDAADVVAETYVIAWRQTTELSDGDTGKLWLYGVTRRVLANHHRSERRRLTRHTELTDEIEHFYTAPSQHHERDCVEEAKNMLAGSDRELLALALWEGLDPGEIATVRQMIRRSELSSPDRRGKVLELLTAGPGEPGEGRAGRHPRNQERHQLPRPPVLWSHQGLHQDRISRPAVPSCPRAL